MKMRVVTDVNLWRV